MWRLNEIHSPLEINGIKTFTAKATQGDDDGEKKKRKQRQ